MVRTLIFLNAVFIPLVFSAALEKSEAPEGASQLEPKYFEDSLENTHGKIIFSTILFRHGDRTPTTTFPTDQYGQHFAEVGFGKLVKAGKQRAYRLGSWARARYANLVPEGKSSTKTLKVYSSDIDRTLETAQMFLAAFCPPQSDEERWNDTFSWQPIPVHAISRSLDNFISTKAPCPRMSWEMNAAKESPLLKTFYEDLGEPTLTYLENRTELKIPRTDPILGLQMIVRVFDTLHSQQKLGLELPTWAKTVYPDPLTAMLEKYFQLFVCSDVAKKLKGGPLIQRIMNSMVNKREAMAKNASTTNIFDVYSAHDTTIFILLNSLGIYNGDFPEFSAAVFIELRCKQNDYFVTVLYRNSEEKAPTLLKLPNCEDPCTLDEFIQMASPLIPKDWNKECNTFDPDYNAMTS